MKIKIKTLSPTLISSGEPSGLIDNDIIFDNENLPYIPAKRLKGLLKESALEVLEILNIEDRKTFFSLFGSPDRDKEAKLDFENLKIENYKDFSTFLKYVLSSEEIFDKSHVLEVFTSIIQQTSIDEKGVAKEGSLRIYRVLDKNMTFEGEIKAKELTKKEEALLLLAAQNLKRIGLRRNRGFGQIEVVLPELETDLKEAIKILKENKEVEKNRKNYADVNLNNEKSSVKKIEFKITTLSPVIISKAIGEQNTVNTQGYITGSSIRGMLANIIIEKLNLKEPHKNNFFKSLFLSEATKFKNAYPTADEKEFYPNSYAIQKENKENPKTYNVAKIPEIIEKSDVKIKPFSAFVQFENENLFIKPVKRKQFFHSSRYKDRTAGRSTDAGIFYYEAIEENQTFKGYISGNEAVLQKLKEILGNEFLGKMGRSKLAQYGTVLVEFGNISDIDINTPKSEKVSITAISPIILLNENGYPDLNEKTLKKYLKEALGNSFEIEDIFARTTSVENYVNTWSSKTSSFSAYSEGSTFIIVGKIDYEKLKELEKEGLGEFTNLGYGQIKINWFPDKEQFELEEFEKEEIPKLETIPHQLFKNMILSYLKFEIETKAIQDAREKENKFKSLSNSLINKLIDLLKVSKDKTELLENLNKLKNLAKDKLDKTDTFEKKPDGKIEFINYEKPINDILQETKNKLKEDLLKEEIDKVLTEYIKNELYKNYWITFFKTILKLRRGHKNE
ncbi:RAMP superfamily CRISPR-associated protein [Persephonella sp. KM09-Lau-8]|uniref:RAMP superfamily CRISPR-associated protein n=1 Tax=Persephonella sp. KM09-Lau-8 TaxID=1158345 RepID=UPI00049675DE|nr:RAMP superfamily CRISPR-associated protein [Persephonella sp. KM09-Lau-8]